MSTFKPSFYQQAIFDFITDGQGNLVINAVAGSGKTTTIVNALQLILDKSSCTFLAFNAAIVKELKDRCPHEVKVQTLHSLGFGAVRQVYNRVQLEEQKIPAIIKKESWNWTDVFQEQKYEYGQRVRKLVDLIRLNLIPMNDIQSLELLADKHEVDLRNGECVRAFEILQIANRDKTIIDYTDMLYMAVTDEQVRKQLPKYKWVFIDECQDLNKCQQELMNSVIRSDGRFICVGDPMQAIYGFAGADVESFNNFLKIPNTISLPLSVNYRCGTEIVDLAKTLVPHLQARPGAPTGKVNQETSITELQDGDMVLCRNTAPLVKCCLGFLAKSRKAYVKGGDIGRNLINLVKKSKTNNLETLFKFLDEELNIVYKTIRKKNPHLDHEDTILQTSYVILQEKITVLKLISENAYLKVLDCEQLLSRLEFIFKDSSQGICFSTIHKAKGLENERVYIIERGLMPAKWAKQEWQKVQEKNLEYVAYTRAKSYLGIITDWSYLDKKTDKIKDGYVGLELQVDDSLNQSIPEVTMVPIVKHHLDPKEVFIKNHIKELDIFIEEMESEPKRQHKSTPGTINKYNEVKMRDGSWKYVSPKNQQQFIEKNFPELINKQ